jgi:hypothetical protein
MECPGDDLGVPCRGNALTTVLAPEVERLILAEMERGREHRGSTKEERAVAWNAGWGSAFNELVRPLASPHHSITSSAVANSVSGMVRPSTLAVLRLMTSSIFVTCGTGRSAGFSPLRMRAV